MKLFPKRALALLATLLVFCLVLEGCKPKAKSQGASVQRVENTTGYILWTLNFKFKDKPAGLDEWQCWYYYENTLNWFKAQEFASTRDLFVGIATNQPGSTLVADPKDVKWINEQPFTPSQIGAEVAKLGSLATEVYEKRRSEPDAKRMLDEQDLLANEILISALVGLDQSLDSQSGFSCPDPIEVGQALKVAEDRDGYAHKTIVVSDNSILDDGSDMKDTQATPIAASSTFGLAPLPPGVIQGGLAWMGRGFMTFIAKFGANSADDAAKIALVAAQKGTAPLAKPNVLQKFAGGVQKIFKRNPTSKTPSPASVPAKQIVGQEITPLKTLQPGGNQPPLQPSNSAHLSSSIPPRTPKIVPQSHIQQTVNIIEENPALKAQILSNKTMRIQYKQLSNSHLSASGQRDLNITPEKTDALYRAFMKNMNASQYRIPRGTAAPKAALITPPPPGAAESVSRQKGDKLGTRIWNWVKGIVPARPSKKGTDPSRTVSGSRQPKEKARQPLTNKTSSGLDEITETTGTAANTTAANTTAANTTAPKTFRGRALNWGKQAAVMAAWTVAPQMLMSAFSGQPQSAEQPDVSLSSTDEVPWIVATETEAELAAGEPETLQVLEQGMLEAATALGVPLEQVLANGTGAQRESLAVQLKASLNMCFPIAICVASQTKFDEAPTCLERECNDPELNK